jgi:HEPN domain-containing protein
MSYDYHDAEMDEAYERLSEELYPGHKALAIIEFTYERLRSYYLQHKELLVPAARTYKSAETLLAAKQSAAALVFAASAIELFLKACLLRPVVAGLVHSESVANLVVESALSQTGFERYEKLLAGLFKELTQLNIGEIVRTGASKPLLEEASTLQKRRNAVVHRGEDIQEKEAEHALSVATAVFNEILAVVLRELGLSIKKGGELVDNEAQPFRRTSPTVKAGS